MTLYLKYRPQTIDDLDLQAVRNSLKSTLSKPEIPHAFLFAGPKGTGKTSAARIVAKALNCPTPLKASLGASFEPCNTCSSCISITRGENLDVVEIDAASHRGIDDIRILREAVKLAPISAKYKIYIIDEAHMLTTEACNALLKVLEEPPSHVIFILATTNPEKLIDTIRSRTTLVQFTKATEDDVVRRLKKVAEGERIDIGNEGNQGDKVLGLIAKAADGAFRDAVKIFEQIISEDIALTEDSVTDFLFGNKSFDPKEFLKVLLAKDTKKALDMIEHGCAHGVSAKTMTRGILEVLRVMVIREVGVVGEEKQEMLELLELFSKAYSEIPSAYLEQLPLEIAVVKWGEGVGQSPKVETAPIEEKHESIIETKRMTRETDAIVTDGVFSDAMWVQVLAEVRPKNAGTEALLRTCKPTSFDGKVLGISVYYTFHKERLEALPHRNLLEEALSVVLGNAVRFKCILTDPPQKKIQEEVAVNHETVLIESHSTAVGSHSTLTESKNDDTIVKAAKDIFGS